MTRLALFVALCAALGAGCAEGLSQARSPSKQAESAPRIDVAKARAEAAPQLFEWAPFEPASFERAKREGRFVLLHGSASWCHFCHVMEAVTYRDPAVGRLLRDRFVAIRVDIDARPDVADRYGEWGWPATILLSPEAEEIGKYRGYLPPDEMREALRAATSAAAPREAKPEATEDARDRGAPIDALSWVAASVALAMDDYYDPREGGWGRRQKAPLGDNLAFEAVRAKRGDSEAAARALFTVEKQRALIDPVWGGFYQYSAASTWNAPHFEKLMTYQAAAIDGYARLYAVTRVPGVRRDLDRISHYVATFLTNAEGAFLVSQDADVGGHDESAPFVDGHDFYAKGDAERRALGMPRIDESVYAYENGLAIAALCEHFEATGDAAVLGRARRAADLLLASLVDEEGQVAHTKSAISPRFLADYAAFGRALARLAQVTGDERYRARAVAVAEAMTRDLGEEGSASLLSHTEDPNAAGVFATRQRPFVHNVAAARFFAALAKLTGDDTYRERGLGVLAATLTPRAIFEQGRMLGATLLAASELGVL